MKTKYLVALSLGFLVMQAADAKRGQPGGKGRGENSAGIIEVLTSGASGLYSDEALNDRYYGLGLDDVADPDNSGAFLDDGDCVNVIVPAADGVDQGKLTFFAPFGPADCPNPGLLRQISIVGTGVVGSLGQPLDGLVDSRFGCADVFPTDSPIGASTHTSCSLEVREYDADGEFDRIWTVDWREVEVVHDAIDVRRLVASGSYGDATVFELVAPAKGKGKKDKVDLGTWRIEFEFKVTRITSP